MHSVAENERILIAETEKAVRESVCFILREEGFTTRCVADTESLLDAIHTSEYRLLIIDIELIDRQVEELIAEKACHTPVIITLFYEHLDNMVGLLQFGLSDFILKPFQFCDLLTRMRQLLSSRMEQ